MAWSKMQFNAYADRQVVVLVKRDDSSIMSANVHLVIRNPHR